MSLIDRLRADLKCAMKARDSIRITALRTMLSALDNASAVEVDTFHVPLQGIMPDVPRKEVSEAEQLAILQAEADGRRRAVVQYEQNGKSQEAARLRAELDVFAAYLP